MLQCLKVCVVEVFHFFGLIYSLLPFIFVGAIINDIFFLISFSESSPVIRRKIASYIDFISRNFTVSY